MKLKSQHTKPYWELILSFLFRREAKEKSVWQTFFQATQTKLNTQTKKFWTLKPFVFSSPSPNSAPLCLHPWMSKGRSTTAVSPARWALPSATPASAPVPPPALRSAPTRRTLQVPTTTVSSQVRSIKCPLPSVFQLQNKMIIIEGLSLKWEQVFYLECNDISLPRGEGGGSNTDIFSKE